MCVFAGLSPLRKPAHSVQSPGLHGSKPVLDHLPTGSISKHCGHGHVNPPCPAKGTAILKKILFDFLIV